MRAFRLPDWGAAPELVEVPVPVPGPGEVLVRVAGNGLCHSDVTMMRIPAEIGGMLGWSVPFTLGHEASGTIAALGGGVEGWAIGDPVVLISANSCRECRFCRGGRESLCRAGLAGRGYGRDGGLADFVVAPVRDLVRWDGPLDLLPDAGTLTDAGATSHHAVSRILPVLERAVAEGAAPAVAVVGVGGLGGYTVQLLRALSPATVIAVDVDEAKRQRAIDLGAHHAIAGVDGDTARELQRLAASIDPGAVGVEVVIDLVGSDATIEASLRALSPGGAYALVGAEGGTLRTNWNGALPHEAEVFTFQGSRPADVAAMVELASSGAIRVETERFPLDDVARAYDLLSVGGLVRRAVVVPR